MYPNMHLESNLQADKQCNAQRYRHSRKQLVPAVKITNYDKLNFTNIFQVHGENLSVCQ